MAADPLAGYTPNDPLAGYTPSAAPASSNPEDIMLQHMASWLPGAAWLHNVTKLGEYGATGGLSNRLDQAFSGSTIDEQDQRLQQARNAVGPYAATAAEALGSLGGVGSITSGAGITGALGQGAALGGLQGVSTSDNPLVWATDAAAGATGAGLLHGALTGVGALGQTIANKIGRDTGALATPEDITKTALANRTAAYGALRTVDVPDAATAVANAQAAYDAADPSGTLAPRTGAELTRIKKRIDLSGQTISGQDAANWLIGEKGTMAPADYADAWTQLQKTGEISFPGTPSAHDLVMSLQKLDKIQGPNAGPDNELAPMVQGHLQSALDNAGAGPLQDAADDAHKVYKNAQFLQEAGQNLQLLKQSPASDAADIAQTYYKQGAADLMANRPTPEAAAFKSLAKIVTAGGGGMSAYGAMHAGAPLVDAAMAGVGGLVGGPTGAVIGEHAGNLVNYGLLKPGAGAALGALSRRATQGAINEAYPTLTGGSRVTANVPDYRRALQSLIMGGGTGALP